ncbi:CcdB family protein [Solilutibacter silvestris]|uniref:Toxin CcdB n=1 Tax=Solilutibacter silvestris TaxID=1645665 RepID=A0A2K1Q2W3_9GAMM|nr:CcdB family protein [Lysobacter silvestris]PNS09321.1 CcdB protein [Lysobacter silvestris]
MSQFFVYANADAASKKQIPYWLNVQSDLIGMVDSRVVVPLIAIERAGTPISRLMPLLEVDGKNMVLDTTQITNAPKRMLGKKVVDLSRERSVIMAALDMLISGI